MVETSLLAHARSRFKDYMPSPHRERAYQHTCSIFGFSQQSNEHLAMALPLLSRAGHRHWLSQTPTATGPTPELRKKHSTRRDLRSDMRLILGQHFSQGSILPYLERITPRAVAFREAFAVDKHDALPTNVDVVLLVAPFRQVVKGWSEMCHSHVDDSGERLWSLATGGCGRFRVQSPGCSQNRQVGGKTWSNESGPSRKGRKSVWTRDPGRVVSLWMRGCQVVRRSDIEEPVTSGLFVIHGSVGFT